MRGRTTRARWYLQQALASAARYRMPFDEALALQALGDIEDARGEHAHAAQHRRQARGLFERLGASWHAAEVARGSSRPDRPRCQTESVACARERVRAPCTDAAVARTPSHLIDPIRSGGGTSAALPCAKMMKTSITTITGPTCLVPTTNISSGLETIAKRPRYGRTHDLLFACFVALAAMIGAATVGVAVRESAPTHAVRL
jgi:hypothetical protein